MNIHIPPELLNRDYRHLGGSHGYVFFPTYRIDQDMWDFFNMFDGCAFE